MNVKRISLINKGQVLNKHNNCVFVNRKLIELIINDEKIYLDLGSMYNLNNCDYLEYFKHAKEKRKVLFEEKSFVF